MKVNKITFLFPAFLLFLNCKSARDYERIEYDNTYKFSSEIEEKVAEDTVDWKYQISAGEYAIKGNYKNALKHWDIAFPGKS